VEGVRCHIRLQNSPVFHWNVFGKHGCRRTDLNFVNKVQSPAKNFVFSLTLECVEIFDRRRNQVHVWCRKHHTSTFYPVSVVTRQTLSPSRVFLGMTDEPREDDRRVAEHWKRSFKEIRVFFQLAPQKEPVCMASDRIAVKLFRFSDTSITLYHTVYLISSDAFSCLHFLRVLFYVPTVKLVSCFPTTSCYCKCDPYLARFSRFYLYISKRKSNSVGLLM